MTLGQGEFPATYYVIDLGDGMTQLTAERGRAVYEEWHKEWLSGGQAAADRGGHLVFIDLHGTEFTVCRGMVEGMWLSTPEARASVRRFQAEADEDGDGEDWQTPNAE